MKKKFDTGEILITTNAQEKLHNEDVFLALERHLNGDWGDCNDANLSYAAVINGGRLLSVYHDSNGAKFWIMTEADKSKTTVLLPEDL